MQAPPPPSTQRAATRRLTRRYSLALTTIAILGILGQLIVQVNIEQLSRDTRVIDIAALQHTLSERLSKAALALLIAPDQATQTTYADELLIVVPQWEHSHLALQQGDASMGLPGSNSAKVTHLFAVIAPSFNAMQDAATKLLGAYEAQPPVTLPDAPPFASVITPYVQEILSSEPGFVTGMDAIVAQYQLEADGRVQRLREIEWTLLTIELGVILLLVLVVFRPATAYVGQSITELVQAQEREHELAALKDQFIVDANHELRTPIMALYNNLEILSAVGERSDAEQRGRILKRALDAGDAVLRLLHNVLDTSALEGKALRLDLKAVPLAPLVHKVLETFDPREIGEPDFPAGKDQSRAVTMHVPPDVVVWADEARLRQILVNLLANALKYSAPGSPIELSADVRTLPHEARRWGGATDIPGAPQVRFSLRDHGLGVPPRDINKLFNRFVRLERDIAGAVRGTGVGLYMCRMLVEAMGGHIWVESSGVPGEGSTFTFTLPIPVPEVAPAAPSRAVTTAPLATN
jgi:signal transduction histidine kinase